MSLLSFAAEPGASTGEIVIRWQSESEVDVAAFELRSSTIPQVDAAQTIAQLPALGSEFGGSSYSYSQAGLVAGETYYFWLYAITADGALNLQRTGDMEQDFVSQVAAVEGLSGSAPSATPLPPRGAPAPAEQDAAPTPPPPVVDTPVTADQPAVALQSPTPAIVVPSPTVLIQDQALSPEPVSSPDLAFEPPAQATGAIPAGPTAALAQRQERPTATPRPDGDSTSSGTRSLLLVVAGGGLCGALVLLLAVLLVWRRRQIPQQ